MKIISDIEKIDIDGSCAVAIGKFDGVHVGHRLLLQKILEKKAEGLLSCVFTFDPPPAVLFGFAEEGELTPKEEKRRIFQEMGIDILIEFPLTFESAAMEPEEFVHKILIERLHVKYMAAGTDLSFGAKGRGDAKLLAQMAKEHDFCVETIEKVCVDGVEVSSTLARKLLLGGKIHEMEHYLGSPYQVMGEVVHGNRIGRTIGFPTVNLIPEKGKLLPAFGVYYSKILYKGRTYFGVSNIGCKPTVNQEKVVGVETHIYNFEEEIYGDDIVVSLYAFKRPERPFPSLEALTEQLQDDMAQGRVYWQLI